MNKAMTLGGLLLIAGLAGCGASGGTATETTTCRASVNNEVTEASTSGPVSYDCVNRAYTLLSGSSVRIDGVVGTVTAKQSDLNLTIESDAQAGVEHRSGNYDIALHGAFDCTDTYVSQLPQSAGSSSELENTIELWSKNWTRIDAQSDCPQWVRDLDPDNYDTVEKQYALATDNGPGQIMIRMYTE